MVEFNDGCVMAQLSNPDMTLPIQYALSYPERKKCFIKPLDLIQTQKLEFYKPDFKKFECLQIAYECAKTGWTMPAVMNASNEIAVKYFLDNKISFSDISNIVKSITSKHTIIKTNNIQKYIDVDKNIRQQTVNLIEERYI